MTVTATNNANFSRVLPPPYNTLVAAGASSVIADSLYAVLQAFSINNYTLTAWVLVESHAAVVYVNQDQLGVRVIDAADPSSAQDLATKGYVDNLVATSIPDYKSAVRAAAQGNLAGTRVGNVITLTALAVLLKATVDSGWSTGPALAVNDRLLLPAQTSNVDNGIYVITSLGVVGVSGAVLTRSSDANTSALWKSEAFVPVSEGTDANKVYKLTTNDPITLNSTGLAFSKPQSGDVTVVGTTATQTKYLGGASVATSEYALHSTRTGLTTDYIVSITDTSAPVIYQAVPMGATSTAWVPLIIKDISYSGAGSAYGVALANTIVFKPVSGKKLNNVTNATLTILNGGGCISVLVDENDNIHQIGFTP